MVNVTDPVRQVVKNQGVESGLAVVYSPHTTAAITVNESWDPDVVHDVLLFLQQRIPTKYPGFRHREGNSDSHLMVNLIGASTTILVEHGDLVLGQWQGIFFCEFDGPRARKFYVQIVGQ
ncbi:MAG: secondary thiamine-phosphate synthase enzyme YjbQ [Firmicutes bacterium]|nr:secondary thiamine-phosphate synthase enzyme YjbQ [Bacillota bacterium]